MTRDEMLAVLRHLEEEFYDDANAAHEDGDRHHNEKVRRWGDALHKAVQLLTPPTTEEIEWLRQLVASSRRCVAVKVRGEKDPPWVMRHGLGRALDALTREPGLLADLAEAKRLSEVWRSCSFNNEQFHHGDLARIAELEEHNRELESRLHQEGLSK